MPAVNSPICPIVNTTSTVTVPGNPSTIPTNITGISIAMTGYNTRAANVTGGAFNINPGASTLTFSFTGTMYDDNTPQSFNVTTHDGSTNTDHTYPFTYTEVESFANAITTYSLPFPNMTTITAPKCQTTPLNFTFANVKYSNSGPSTPAVYGTVTQYQYLLPSGWSLGSTVSDGATWITSNNNVMITPDATTGDGGLVQVRGVNSCNASLIPGPAGQIHVSRPSPSATETLTASDNTDYICSGSKTFTVNNLPTSSTISWSLVGDPGTATIPAGSTGASVSVTAGTTSGSATLKATVTDCDGTHTLQEMLHIGTPNKASFGIGGVNNMTMCVTDFEFNHLFIVKMGGGTTSFPYTGSLSVVDASGSATSYKWVPLAGGSSTTANYTWEDDGGGLITIKCRSGRFFAGPVFVATNGCGSASQQYNFTPSDCSIISAVKNRADSATPATLVDDGLGSGQNKLTVYPNPAHDIVSVLLPDSVDTRQTIIKVADVYGRLVSYVVPVSRTTEITVSGLSSGVYFIEVIMGGKLIATKKLLKN